MNYREVIGDEMLEIRSSSVFLWKNRCR